MADYTTIDDPSAHFQIKLYTGNASNPRNLTNDGNSDLKPDWLWLKNRTDDGTNHVVANSSIGWDAPKGVGYPWENGPFGGQMSVDDLGAESTPQATYGYISAALTDGFTAAAGGTNGDTVNKNSKDFVAWQWKANGGTTSANTAGGINSEVQVNATAGFSIVTFTSDGTTNTVGHGLGVKPDVVMVKSRSAAGGMILITDKINGSMDYGYLHVADDFADIGYDAPTSTVFQFNNNNGITHNAYCFTEIQGYSKFGQYYGNGQSTEGPFVYCGFKPAWVMIKNTQTDARPWYIFDNARRTFNPNGTMLESDTTDAEATDQAIDMYSNGFKVRPGALGSYGTSSTNHSAQYMFYMAFAESPFVSSEGTPTTAN